MAAPTYGDRRVQTNPLSAPLTNPGIASPDAFGAPIAAGARSGLQSAFRGQQLREQEREKVADTKAMDAYLKLSEADGQLSSKSKLKTGANARGLPDAYNQEYAKLVAAQSSSLKDDPDAQQVFAQMAERRRVASVDDIQRHADRELLNFQKSTWEAGQMRARMDGQNGIISLDESLAQQDGNRRRLSDIEGIPAAEHEILWQADKDKTIAGFISQKQQSGDLDAAQQTLDKYATAMSPDLRAKITADLSNAKESMKAQTYAAAIMQNPNQTKAQAYQQLKMIDNPELRERTRINVEREFAQRDAVKAEAQGSTYESFADAIDAGESYDELIAKNPLAAGVLTESQSAALRRAEQNAINRRQPEEWGDAYVTARNTWSEFPEEFAKMDLRTYKGRVTKAEWDDLNERQQQTKAQLTRSVTKTPEVARGFQTINEVVKSTLREIGINPNVEDGEIDPRALSFTRQMDKRVEALGGAAVVTNDQIRKIADDLLIEVTVEKEDGGWFWFDSKEQVRTFELPNADRIAYSVEQIPAQDRARAIKALADAGIVDPRPDEIMEYYNGSLEGQVSP